MSNEDIFNAIKDKFAGVVGMSATTIDLATTDGQVFTVDQASFEKDYWIVITLAKAATAAAITEVKPGLW